jgi:hypothetical protein
MRLNSHLILIPKRSFYVSHNITIVTLSFICLGESVKKIDELASEALIFDLAPCKAGKNTEWIKAGL